MGKIADSFQLNLAILTQCREQMNLSITDVKTHVQSIADIENGNKTPTYKQLSKLEELYQVPRWVFISNVLPDEYQYKNQQSFRTFKNSQVFQISKIPQLITRVKKYRDLFIELREDLNDPIQSFNNPFLRGSIDDQSNTIEITERVKEWLEIQSEGLDFLELKDKVEQKGIFVFLTNKYKGWDHITTDFRGLAINDGVMPIIVINNSDSKKAHSFTLMHELAHIIRGDMGIDGEDMIDSEEEKWCDRFAGEMLMPTSSLTWELLTVHTFMDIKKLATYFKVSPYACAVRLRQLSKISQADYLNYEDELIKEYVNWKDKLRDAKGGPPRDRSQEVKERFGNNFIATVLTAWHNQDMTLHKVAKLFDFKNPEHVRNLERLL